MDETIIEIKGLNKTYKIRNLNKGNILKRVFSKKTYTNKEAIKSMSLKVKKGEFIGLIGHNGAGKSTLIKVLIGILHPTSGEVSVLGRDPFKYRMINNNSIGVVFGQRTQLNWDLPTIEYLQLLKKIYKISDETYNQNMELFIETFDMKKIISRPVRTLSLGERMQCEIMAAFLHSPSLIFLDEPTIGLDILNKEKILNMLKHIKSEGNTTLVLTTHDLEDISLLCDKTIILSEGDIIHEGNIDAMLEEYNKNKRVTFTSSTNMTDHKNTKLSVDVKYDQYKIICDSVEKSKIQDVIAEITDKFNIIDISIEGINFTEVVKDQLRREHV